MAIASDDPHRPQPDWQATQIVLVDPSIWREYQRPGCDLRPMYRDLADALTSLGVDVRILAKEDHPLDIWIRDWGFVGDCYFKYSPTYARGLYPQSAIRKARQHLDIQTGQQRRVIPLVLDGGNLVHNGRVAILTEKVLQDNPQMTRLEIERTIISLGFERVVFIPVEPEDVIGHADGILRFVSPDVLLVNEYTGSHFQDYKRQVMATLKRAKLHAELFPVPWFSTDQMNDGVWSAIGCYVNFILTACGIVPPTFEHRFDECATAVLAEHTKLRVRQVPATPLARLGGVLNCVSSTL
jgi:agmatine/peptidylarginine deiminase